MRTKLKCLWRNCTQNIALPRLKPRGTRTEWTKEKGLELTHTSGAVLGEGGQRKTDGASTIPRLLSPGRTGCVSPAAPCQGAGEHAHLPTIANSWGVTTVSVHLSRHWWVWAPGAAAVQRSKRTNVEDYSTHELQCSLTTFLGSDSPATLSTLKINNANAFKDTS